LALGKRPDNVVMLTRDAMPGDVPTCKRNRD
jgi:hypothetical protein